MLLVFVICLVTEEGTLVEVSLYVVNPISAQHQQLGQPVERRTCFASLVGRRRPMVSETDRRLKLDKTESGMEVS